MARVITSLCVREGACATVCPVECIVPGKPEDKYPWYYIDAETCIDCGACESECPVSAIFPADDVPANWKQYTDMNADWYQLSPEDYQAKWNQPGKTA